jgi:hypothetical protein
VKSAGAAVLRLGTARESTPSQPKRRRHERLGGFDLLVPLKTPWRDRTDHIALEPQELLEKLAALIPRPYTNLIVYREVLEPNAKWRAGLFCELCRTLRAFPAPKDRVRSPDGHPMTTSRTRHARKKRSCTLHQIDCKIASDPECQDRMTQL